MEQVSYSVIRQIAGFGVLQAFKGFRGPKRCTNIHCRRGAIWWYSSFAATYVRISKSCDQGHAGKRRRTLTLSQKILGYGCH